jgi:hypothetical protein
MPPISLTLRSCFSEKEADLPRNSRLENNPELLATNRSEFAASDPTSTVGIVSRTLINRYLKRRMLWTQFPFLQSLEC